MSGPRDARADDRAVERFRLGNELVDGPRLFVAVPLTPAAMAAVAELVAGIRLAPEPAPGERRDPADVRWVRMDGLHLTLRFLGPTEPDRIPLLADAVRQAAGQVGEFEIGLAGAGVFPNPTRPRVLWLGLGRGIEPLNELTAGLGLALAERGWPFDDRPVRPHLTLARSDGVAAGPLMAGRLLEAAANLDVRWTAEQVVLFESQTGGGPARYLRRLEVGLAPAP